MTYFFETYGCQMNIAESAALEQLLIARGWTGAPDAETADMVIINTCSVRATAENRIFGRLGWYSGLKAVRACLPGAKSRSLEKAAEFVREGPRPLTLVVTGCMAERLLDSLKKDYPCIDYVVGTFAKQKFGDVIDAVVSNGTAEISDSGAYEFAPLSYEPGSFSAFVPIMHGCNNFCTYCIVPYVRGREISRSPGEIINELDVLSSYGVKEITLLGQNVNSYSSGGTDFAGLLMLIDSHLEESASPIRWVRFMSSHPKDLSDAVIDVVAGRKRICRHIHLPVQHGSSEILRRMNRRYSREDYIALVDRIRRKIPDVSLTTDIMVGFPGETDGDLELTLDLMRKIRYENAFMYYYNPREGTPAASYADQIPLEVKKARLQRVIDLQLEVTSGEMARRTGRTVTVLAESVSRDNPDELLGKTEQDERVAFRADRTLIGKFVDVHIDVLSGNTFRGTLVERNSIV